jgi:4-hydroxy-4-methyl-2-oxoglutarate aldolase
MSGSPKCLASAAFVGVLIAAAPIAPTVSAQIQKLTPEQLTRYTPLNPYERFPDGRPKVPDTLVNTIREMGIEVEEAWGVLRGKGFTNQYEANWKVLVPEKRLVGRAFTVQFMPTRPDLADAAQKEADERGFGRLRNQTAIDLLQSGDVAVVDLFGKVEGGTFVGDKLAYYINKTTGTGLVVDGALFYLSRIQKTGMPAYYRGTHPGALTEVILTGVNVPVRIGDAIVMPGDIVLGDREGILFIPPQFVEEVIESARTQRLRDAWVKGKFDTGKYKSGEIYGRPRDPELLKEMEEFMKKKPPATKSEKPPTTKPEK